MIRTIGDFVDECDRMGNPSRRFNFRKTDWGPIQGYMDDQIKVICYMLSQEMVRVLGKSPNKSEMQWVAS